MALLERRGIASAPLRRSAALMLWRQFACVAPLQRRWLLRPQGGQLSRLGAQGVAEAGGTLSLVGVGEVLEPTLAQALHE